MSGLTSREKQAVALLAEIAPEPGDATYAALWRDSYNVYVHWRTAESLASKGYVELHDWGLEEAHVALVGHAQDCRRCPAKRPPSWAECEYHGRIELDKLEFVEAPTGDYWRHWPANGYQCPVAVRYQPNARMNGADDE